MLNMLTATFITSYHFISYTILCVDIGIYVVILFARARCGGKEESSSLMIRHDDTGDPTSSLHVMPFIFCSMLYYAIVVSSSSVAAEQTFLHTLFLLS